MELIVVDSIVDEYRSQAWALISILQDIQDRYGYLSQEVLRRVSEKMEIPLPQIYGLATFYKSLNLVPRGKHDITICAGTACHVRGSNKILKEITNYLNVKPGGTTEDNEFTLNVVNCLGACAIGPVVVIDGEYYGKMSASKVKDILAKIQEE